MTFTKYSFNQSSLAANTDDVVSWLSENATEYFDSFRKDTPPDAYPLVVCTLGGVDVLKFSCHNPANPSNYTNIATLVVTTITGSSATEKGVPQANDAFSYVKYALKSNSGIMLYMSDNYTIYITKSNAGTTAVYVKWRQSGTNGINVWKIADLVNSLTISTASLTSKVEQHELTALIPLVFPSGTYSPALFLTPYTQYKGYTGIIDVDGTKYAYDGCVALSE